MSFSGRAQSNSRGSEYYRIPRQDQHPQQQQPVHRPPSSRSHSRGPPPNDESRDNSGIARSSSIGRPLRSPTPERGNSRPRKPSPDGDAWTRSSSRSRLADTNRRSITPNSTTANHGGGAGVGVRDREDANDGRSIRRMQSSKNDSKIGRSDSDMSRGRSGSERTPPSSRSHSRGPPPNDESRDNSGIARSSSIGRPLRSPTPERGNSRPRKPSPDGDAWTRSSSRSRLADTNRRSITPNSTTANHGGGAGVGVRDREDANDGRSIRRMQSSKNDSKIGRSDSDMSRGRSGSERTPGASQSRDMPTRLWDGRSSSQHSSRYGQEFRRTDSVRSRGRLSAERTPKADVRSDSRSPMGLWDERSSSRHSSRKRADRREGQGRQHHEEEETRRCSPSPSGRETRRPLRDPSGERRSLSRTPSLREDNVPRDRLSPPRSSVEVYRGEQSQSFDGRYAGKATPSTTMEKSLSSTRHKDKQKRHPQGCQKYNPDDATDFSQSTGFLSKQTIKSSSSNHKSPKKHINSKATGSSVRSYSSSETPETGPLTSSTGKSSKGNFLKLRISSLGGVGGRMSLSTPPQNDVSICLSRVPIVKDDSTNGSIMDEEEIATCLFDRKGYCIRHPSVQLRKKKLFGAWNVIMVNCPECCMDEMRRLRRMSKQMAKSAARVDGAGRKNNGGSGEEKGAKSKKKAPRGVQDLEQKKQSSDRSPVSRSLSRSRSRKETSDATDAKKFAQRSKSRSKSHRGHHDTPSGDNSPPIFEFEIPLDAHGDLSSSYSPAPRSIKSHKSSSSKKSSGKSTRTNKTSKSMSGRGSSIKRESRGLSSSSQREKGKSRDGDSRSVSRESRPRSSQRITRQGSKLQVSKMPYKDHNNREGSYTGEINEYGQPNGRGTLRYMDGTEFEGKWKDGHSEEIDASMEKLKNGFSNWKSNTKMSKGGIGSQQSTEIHSSTGAPTISKGGEGQQHGRVSGMKWSDVNGFSGHYSGDVDSQHIPHGCGLMRYTNGVVEEGVFCNGVFQPPTTGPFQPSSVHGDENKEAPSSSMSVWSLKSSPTMAFGRAGHSVLAGHYVRDNGGMGASSVRGAPSSVHLCGPGGL
ncbi:hypothetical protein ACHAW5_004186 [Stephanodiscus triporus]|uniref:Uncharacterized protein n=1 Tax=Stephanodiscus triporus TaxID=2934178 RepID=A0ABD3PSR9_9STRA